MELEQIKFTLFGSRKNGNSRPDSDWDVCIVSSKVNDETNPKEFCSLYRDKIRKHFSIPKKHKVDLFCANPEWKLAVHENAYWDENHHCYIGYGDFHNINTYSKGDNYV